MKFCGWNSVIFSCRKHKRKIGFAVLFLLMVFHFVHNILMIYGAGPNMLVRGKDWQTHLRNFNNVVQKINHGEEYPGYNKERSLLFNLVKTGPDYPPFFYWCAALIHFLFRRIMPEMILMISTLFFLVLLVMTYKIAEYFLPGTGIFAVFICSFLPGLRVPSLFFNLEMAAAAMIGTAIYLLLKTANFQNRRRAVVFGGLCGLGMLTKYTFGLFLFVPVMAVLFHQWKKARQDKTARGRLINFGMSMAAAAAQKGFFRNWTNCLLPGLSRTKRWNFIKD